MRDKDSQEIAAILQVMPETYSHSFGHALDKDMLKTYLNDLLNKKKLAFLDSALNHMTPRSITELMAQLSQSNNFEPIADKIEPMNLSENDSQLARKSVLSGGKGKSSLKKKV